jgi:hypothetical protein
MNDAATDRAYAWIVVFASTVSHAGRRIGIVILFGTIGMALGGWRGRSDLRSVRQLTFRVPGWPRVQSRQPHAGTMLHRQGRTAARDLPA